MKQLIIVLLFCVFHTNATPNYCCKNDGIIIDSKCSDGGTTWAKKHCTEGAYMLFAVDYNLTADQSLLISEHFQIIASDRFCLTAIETEKEGAALICFPSENEESTGAKIVISILCIISMISLFLTLIVYACLPNLRDLQGKCMISTILSLMLAFLFLSIIQRRTNFSTGACITIASLTYFWFAAVFLWLNVVAFNVWRSVVKPKFLTNKQYLYPCYNLYGWGGALIMLIITVLCQHTDGDHLKPDFGDVSCWFRNTQAMWAYFYGPISFLISLNIVMFISTAWTLWRTEKVFTERKRKSHKFKFLLYLKLSLIMGVCWIFEPMSAYMYEGSYIWLLTDYINSLQGLTIFLLLVVFRKRVRRDLARRFSCNSKITKEWATMPDEECEEMDEELEELTSTNGILPETTA